MKDHLPLPPFAKILQAYQDEGIYPEANVYWPTCDIYVGKYGRKYALNQIQQRAGIACYLPYGQDYNHFRWPIKSQNILLINTGFTAVNFIKKMAVDLFMQYQPLSVIAYGGIFELSESDFMPDQLIIILKDKNHDNQ